MFGLPTNALSSAPEAKRAEELAKKLGTEIPENITAEMWALPILEAMAERIEKLEQQFPWLMFGKP